MSGDYLRKFIPPRDAVSGEASKQSCQNTNACSNLD
jgi:hypothetical protein